MPLKSCASCGVHNPHAGEVCIGCGASLGGRSGLTAATALLGLVLGCDEPAPPEPPPDIETMQPAYGVAPTPEELAPPPPVPELPPVPPTEAAPPPAPPAPVKPPKPAPPTPAPLYGVPMPSPAPPQPVQPAPPPDLSAPAPLYGVPMENDPQ